ncbi:MAG TPA: CHASE2 domain-containing protein [Candidimonas sp.]|nr:CHASE2 domain-containing protein [Candidimonas sp.]
MLYFLLGVWAIQGNPFGLSSAADKALSDELARIRAYVTPVAPAPITIVAIDWESINGLHNHNEGWMLANDWPLSYPDHTRILRDLLFTKHSTPPSAIFYDIFFERPRLNGRDPEQAKLADLGRTLGRWKNNPKLPPVFLAGGGVHMPMSAVARQALEPANLVVTAWEGYGDFYPLHAMLRKSDGPTPSRPLPLAATALYLELCKSRGENCEWARSTQAAPLAVQWEVLDKAGCSMTNPTNGWRRVVLGIGNIAGRMLGMAKDTDTATGDCLPFHQVRLSELYTTPPADLRPPHLAPGEPYVVLAGLMMKSLKDYHQTPLYGQIEGVYLHAAALENLNRLGRGYIHDRDLRFLSIAVWGILLLAFWPFLRRRRLPAATGTSQAMGTKASTRVRWVLRRLLWWSIFILGVIGLYIVFYEAIDVAPEGWLSLIALIPLLKQVVSSAEHNLEQGGE